MHWFFLLLIYSFFLQNSFISSYSFLLNLPFYVHTGLSAFIAQLHYFFFIYNSCTLERNLLFSNYYLSFASNVKYSSNYTNYERNLLYFLWRLFID